MGSKVVTIEPDYSTWKGIPKEHRISDEPIQVIFTWGKAKLDKTKRHQTVTHCLLRQGIRIIGRGYAIENPLDEPDNLEGFHWAFKRSILSMFYFIQNKSGITYSLKFKKNVDKAFRQALWEAMNK